ncbi:type II secretion system protein E [Methanocaldococcus bathoardescens]|uniref:Type II secretion system protein E n=1 Tax=Methanocaldococcus bathoardescens TaxID=1301915 RepID=A0A076LGE9_9EURY|nr:ATPase, T2SS/T4P/T4SS family [Methanocaldococcus bathoardescens]AIJ05957.1 type II secretion system protein E [Methanocaldococcus bathoardescens]
MGLFDKIQKKTEKSLRESTTASSKKDDILTPTIKNDITLKKENFGVNGILDSYTVTIDEISVDIVIKKEGGFIYYLIPEIEKINTALSKLSKDNINLIKMQIGDLGLIEYSQIKNYLSDFSTKYNLNIPYIDSLAKYFYLISGRLGLLEIPINDDRLEEIMVNGYNLPVFVFHRKHQMCETNIVLDRNEVDRIIESIANLVNRPIDSRFPMLDAFLPDGSRVNATTADITMNGATLTIRKFSKNPLTVIDLINFGTLDIDTAAFLWQAVEGYFGAKPANTLIVGGTGSGKTTLLNVLSLFSMYNERIITIEDTPELQIPHKHVIKMVTRPARPGMPEYEITMDDLIKNALRMRPDRIFVGEVRGEEAHSLLVAMNTGHDGALAYDEPIYLSDGNVVKIGDFVDKFFNNRKGKKERNGFEWINIEDENIFIKSFNKSTLKIEDKRITRVWRKRYRGKLLKIKTKSGKEITLTHDHPIYKMNNKIFEINAEMAKVGDYIALPRELKINGKENIENPSSKNELYKINTLNSNELKILANSDIYWDEIVDIQEIYYDGYIYDLTVEDNHTYIAGKYGGIIVSNCSGTLHANSADEAILRLTSPPMNVPKIMLTALDFIINQQRIRRAGKTVRRILGIVEIVKGGGEGHKIAKTTLYEYNGLKDRLERKGICMWEEEVCEIAGISREELLRDRENRKRVISYLYKNNIRQLEDVAKYIMNYQTDPEKLLKSISI